MKKQNSLPLADWVKHVEERLANAGVESPKLEAQVLAAHALGRERSEILAHPEWDVPESAESLLQRRLALEPLAYILGYREFYGRKFRVTPDVLIPRQETEILIEAFSSLAPSLPNCARVLDLGTGSGCIGITLKLEHPALQVVLSDISEPALEVARENAQALDAEVGFALEDAFDISHPQPPPTVTNQTEGWGSEEPPSLSLAPCPLPLFDVIVSNPPYVAESDKLPDEVRLFEPVQALFSGPTGLEFYERLAAEAGEHLNPGGLLLLEVGDTQAQGVRDVFADWQQLGCFRDLMGIERALAFKTRHS